MILFSAASVTQTFKLIDTLVFPDHLTLLLRGFVLPALTSAIYIFLYPYPAKFVFGFTRRRQKEINNLRSQIENETPLTLEESRKIRAEVAQIENDHSQELDHNSREIDRLKNEINELRSAPTETSVKASAEPSITLEPTQLELLRMVEKFKGNAPEKSLIIESKESQVKTEYDLGELVDNKLLTRTYDNNEDDYVFKFTHTGRSYLLTHGNKKKQNNS